MTTVVTRRDFLRELRRAGGKFKRHGKHDVYELPNGRRVVVPRGDGDPRAWRNAAAQLRRIAASKKRLDRKQGGAIC